MRAMSVSRCLFGLYGFCPSLERFAIQFDQFGQGDDVVPLFAGGVGGAGLDVAPRDVVADGILMHREHLGGHGYGYPGPIGVMFSAGAFGSGLSSGWGVSMTWGATPSLGE